MRSQRPYLSLFVILHKGSVMALIDFVLFIQYFVHLFKSNALHESFRSKESVWGALTKHMFVHLETWRSAEIALKPGNIVWPAAFHADPLHPTPKCKHQYIH